MAGYVGNVPVPQATQTRQSFTATASQTSFPTIGYTEGFFDCHLNGVKLLAGVDFNVGGGNGSDVILATGAALNDILEVTIFDTFTTSSASFANATLTSSTLKSNVTLKNDTHEDSDGGRASKIIYQGEQSGGEISTLAEIQASHDGTADDEKSDLIFRTNDGSDGTSPTERVRINSLGQMGINTSSPDANGFGSGNGILAVASDTGSAKTAMVNLIGDGNDTDNARVASLFYNDASATGAGSTIAGIEAYRASNHATDPGANLVFSTNVGATGGYAEKMRIRAAGGITFNGDTAAANALNDYETGTFQMSVAGVSGGARGSGLYVKVGNLVHFQWYSGGMTVTSATPLLTGLPFTSIDPHNSAAYSGFVAYHNTYVSNANTGYVNIGSTSLYFTALNSTGGATIGTGSSKYVMVAGTYYAA